MNNSNSTAALTGTARAPLRVLIAAGGSGGHLFPARFIAQAFLALDPTTVIKFVGSGRPLEAKIIDGAGFERFPIDIVGVKQRGIRGFLQFVRMLPNAMAQTRRVIREFRPHVVIGVGGYASVLPIFVGVVYRAKTWIHEAEIRPGLANGILSFFVDGISVAFANSLIGPRRKVVYTGHPLRPELADFDVSTLPTEQPTNILVIGGSQGARALDEVVGELAPFLAQRKVKLVHQTRPDGAEALMAKLRAAGVDAQVVPFIEDMAGAYDWAHIIVSRSGASSILELSVVNRPAILVPFPFAQADHQRVNAKTLSSINKALLVEEGPRFADRLRDALDSLLSPERYRQMWMAPNPGRRADGAARIARECRHLAGYPAVVMPSASSKGAAQVSNGH